MLSNAERQFIREHFEEDVHRLLLSASRYPGISMPVVANQIEALRKVRGKAPSWFRFDLEFPPLLSVEQASSEAAARFKAGLFSGHSMADLTGGMGVDACFFAQQFQRVTYVEAQPDLVALARRNFDVLGLRNINAIQAEAEIFLQQTADSFDLLYLDPSRRAARSRRVFQLADCRPDVPALRDKLLETAARVLVKTAPLLDLRLAATQLGPVARIWVVSVGQECKEVLYLLEKTAPPFEQVPIEAVCIGPTTRSFRFTRAEENAASPVYSAPQHYLYEPDAAVLKAGAFKSFATRYGLGKLHPHTHLYTSTAYTPEVPGRVFEVEQVLKYDRKAVQKALPEGRAQVTARNFPDTVEKIRKKLGLEEGGDRYLFGATGATGRLLLICCRRALDITGAGPPSLHA
ncbi:MAG: hypothetical protein IPH12_13445 [Saprospirales bacterium]|nr:hypothetical protein [Saprospirales bacterium]